MKDWLFLLQFLIIFLLAFALASPFTFYQHDISADNTVIVIDVSASSQTDEGVKTRFDTAQAKALDSLGSTNTIILAKDIPFMALKEASSSKAGKFLKDLTPKATETQLGEAIILAGEVLAGQEGRVVVISDFINTGGQDPETAKAILQSKGLVVDFINTVKGNIRENIGIVNIDIDNVQTSVYVKNFNEEQKTIKLKIGSTEKQLTISGKGTESYSFATPEGVTKITLSPDDDFPVDNTAYISAPSGEKTKVALISNNPSVFLTNALEASGEIELTVVKPPVIPDDDFDIYIVADLDKSKVLSGTFNDLEKKFQKGADFIFCAQEDSEEFDYVFAPVDFDGRKDGGFVNVEQLNKFTKNIDFGSVEYLFNAKVDEDAVVIAASMESPLIAFEQEGNARSVYFGFLEKGSGFKFSPGYPIFWTELIKFLTGKQEASALNFKTGQMLVLEKKQLIKMPSKNIKTSALLLDEQGIYYLQNRVITANLMSDKESNVNPEKITGTKSVEYELKPVKEKREKPWAPLLIIFALILVLIELWYVKMRGDL